MAIANPDYDYAGLAKWRATRPKVIRDLIDRLPPDRLYRIKASGHRCTIRSYTESGEVTVTVSGQFNRVIFGRNVFGIKPEDLEECDLPDPDEDLGDTSQEAGYSEEDVTNILIPQLRKAMEIREARKP